jgi:hypothetical protein
MKPRIKVLTLGVDDLDRSFALSHLEHVPNLELDTPEVETVSFDLQPLWAPKPWRSFRAARLRHPRRGAAVLFLASDESSYVNGSEALL